MMPIPLVLSTKLDHSYITPNYSQDPCFHRRADGVFFPEESQRKIPLYSHRRVRVLTALVSHEVFLLFASRLFHASVN